MSSEDSSRQAKTPDDAGRRDAADSVKVRLPRWWRRRERPLFKVPGRLDKRVISADKGRLQEVARRDRDHKLQAWKDLPEARDRKIRVGVAAVLFVGLIGVGVGVMTRNYGPRVTPQHQMLHDLLMRARVSYRMNVIVLEGERKSPLYILQSKDLAGLEGIPLPAVYISNRECNDIGPLKGMPLVCLLLNHTEVSDITPLAGMPLEYLDMRSTRVTNVAALAGMPLKSVAFPTRPFPKGVEVLKDIKSLKLINKTKAEDFWLLFDRGLLPHQMDDVPFTPPPVPPPPSVARPRPADDEPVEPPPAVTEILPIDPDSELP